MTRIRLALAQMNPTVGDIAGNSEKVLVSVASAHAVGADLLATPEMMIPGYPIEDLALRASFASACMDATTRLASQLLDSDSLPDYDRLDAVLDAYVERDQGADHLAQLGFDSEIVEKVVQMTDTAEYKRRQYPPGSKITLKAFGRDRGLPITNRWREHYE